MLFRHLEEVIEEEPTIEKKQLPPHIELTVDILNRSLHFLPSKDEGRQILVLQVSGKISVTISNFKNITTNIILFTIFKNKTVHFFFFNCAFI